MNSKAAKRLRKSLRETMPDLTQKEYKVKSHGIHRTHLFDARTQQAVGHSDVDRAQVLLIDNCVRSVYKGFKRKLNSNKASAVVIDKTQ